MDIGRVQDQNIRTSVNATDRTNMPLSESLTREEILHKYEPAAPIHVPSNNMTFE